MNNSAAAVISSIIAALSSVGAVSYSVNEARRTRREQKAAADGPALARLEREAYERARQMYEAGIHQVEATAMRAERRAVAAEDRATECERKADALSRTVAALRAYLRAQGIPIPAHLDGDDD